MLLATWNLNNRVGMVPFRPEAAQAAIALGADVIVFTEYYPQEHHRRFCNDLREAGWVHQLMSPEAAKTTSRSPADRTNRVFIVSRLPMWRDALAPPNFDRHALTNTAVAHLPTLGLRILGLRIPAYVDKDRALLARSWEWLEHASTILRGSPAVIVGDLNVRISSGVDKSGGRFRKILEGGWERAVPAEGFSYFGKNGARSEIDHILCNDYCSVRDARYCKTTGDFALADHPNALSDHAALVAEVEVEPSAPVEPRSCPTIA